MLVLFETPAGFALFKVLDERKLSKVDDLWKEFSSADTARQVVKLKAFSKFENTSEALSAATLLVESKPNKGLRKFLRAHCDGESLAVADSKLGNVIKEKLQIDWVHNQAVMELMRGVRSQLTELITGLAIRYDALGDNQDNSMGVENRLKLEARLRNLEGWELGCSAGSTKGKPKIEAYNKDFKKGDGAMITPA
ncbi:hypothetical protein HanOQP8_Chr15g0568191 [Helianthus annuus]|nr:hypothetical protein HanIR_Chr15g0747141 [Helianthus annuus]KAJ0472647.1 hypothetical protein HanHA89_Chr15g0609381 [Helianthus annuus]KAJ0648249.1 hypothetical protein HanLR1_Chr15g0570751 [Helianthus annuus]KAJ0652091.1 hypothetical protein HanOQP8_Chr15g0568191 [Helianthus annuus]